MPYGEDVICFSGGIHEYIGRLDQAKHKMGENWYRILDPCVVKETPDGRFMITPLQGSGDFFKKYVDIRIPPDSIIEIKTVDPAGEIMEIYKKQIERRRSQIIKLASPGPGMKLH